MMVILIEALLLAAVALILYAVRDKVRFFRGGYTVRRASFKEADQPRVLVEDTLFFRRRERGMRSLRVDGTGIVYSRIPLSKEKNVLLVYGYCAPLLAMLKGIGTTPERALVLGGGGGAVPLYLLRGYETLHVDVVEISAECVRASRTYFVQDYAGEGGRANIIHDDAKNAVKTLTPAYQFIFCDLYVGGKLAGVVYDEEFMRDVSRLAGTDGLFVLNGGGLSGQGVHLVLRNLLAAFDMAWAMLLSDGYVLLARNSAMPALDNLLLHGQGVVPIYPSPFTEESLRGGAGDTQAPLS